MDRLGNIIDISNIGTTGKAGGELPNDREFQSACADYDADVASAKAELIKLVCLLPSPGTEQDPETRSAVYWNILKGELSPENIAKVCRKAMTGSVGGSKFLPSPGELIIYANKWFQRGQVRRDPRIAGQSKPRLAAPEHRKLPPIDKPCADDERARIAHKFNQLASSLGEVSAAQKDKDRRLEPKYGPVIPISELRSMDVNQREKHKIAAEEYLDRIKAEPMPQLSKAALAGFNSENA